MTPIDREPAARSQERMWSWMSRVDPRRSFLLLGIGALVGLGFAGFGLFTARGTSIGGMPPEDAALVNRRPILKSDLIAQVETLSGRPFGEATEDEKRRALNDMIREELFVQRGLELDFPSTDPDTRTALVAAVEQQVAADVTSARTSDDELKTYYAAHRDRYASEGQLLVTDLVLPTARPANAEEQRRAEQAATALRGGLPPSEAIARFGLRDTRRTADGEEFYFAAKLHLGPVEFPAAAGVSSGGVSAPVQDSDGLHILVVAKNEPPVPLSFEDARTRVLNDFKKDAQIKLEQSDERYLRSKAEIAIAPGLPR